MVIICREPDGRWYVTFAIGGDGPEPLAEAGHAVGVGLGVTDFAVTSDGDKIASPRHLERRARSLARYQRRLARCRNGSANRAKAAAKVARAHRMVRCARQDCGARHDRDINAAKNILAAGLAVTACGAGVSHSGTSRVRPAVKQEPRPVTAGLPVLQGGE